METSLSLRIDKQLPLPMKRRRNRHICINFDMLITIYFQHIHDSCLDWYNVVSGSEIYHNNFFDQGFVTAETCSLHGADVGSEPGHEQELGSLAHFIATLNRDVPFHIPHKWTGHGREEKSRNEWNGSFFFRCYSYRNANKSERTFVVRKEGAEIVEIDAHRFATDLIGVEMKNGPAQKGTNRQRIGGSNDTVDILTQI